ncbi:hypothetical protein H5410_000890, partial [Solanum commersonii]
VLRKILDLENLMNSKVYTYGSEFVILHPNRFTDIHFIGEVIRINLKRILFYHCKLKLFIPIAKVLEVITTKKCLQKFHLKSLSIQLFKTYENHHEGLFNITKYKLILSVALFKLGCDHKFLRFIRNEPFNLKMGLIPRDNPQEIRSKREADVVEALICAYLNSGGEVTTLSFMKWIGMDIDFIDAPIIRHFLMNVEKLVTCTDTWKSSYAVTTHLYFKYLGLNPRLITYLRSTFVNNECYAEIVDKASLHKHIFLASTDLQRQICCTIEDF